METASIRDIPLYDADRMAEGMPAGGGPAQGPDRRRRRPAPGHPGVQQLDPRSVKNAIDWLSRPASDIPSVFGGRPVALMGATTGPGGTILAQNAWLPVLRILGTRPWFGPRLTVSGAKEVFDEDGRLADEGVREKLKAFMAGFGEFVGERRKAE